MPKKFFLFLAILCLLAAPARAASLIGQPCDNVGTTKLDLDEKNIVACLKTDAGTNLWKGTTSGGMESFQTFGQLKGYQKLPSGLILQWTVGPVFWKSDFANARKTTIDFPIPFPTACLNVQVSGFVDQYGFGGSMGLPGWVPIPLGDTGDDNGWFQVIRFDRFNTTLFPQAAGNNPANLMWPLVFAIGY